MTGAPRTILHADMDAFYVSVELRRRPELAGKPVVVGGTGPRGVVAAASYEARRFGVHSALPSAVARRRCPHAVFLPGDHELYGEVSGQVHDVFGRYTPVIEPLALDEAFLDVTGARRLFGDGATIAHEIRRAIRDELDLGCSVGVASNKFLAKLASVDAKPTASPAGIEPGPGVFVIEPDGAQRYLDRLPVGRLWGVGPKTLEKLERIGVRTVRDLRGIDPSSLAAALGRSQADHLAALAVGADDREVESDRDAKSIGHEETYPHDKFTHDELSTELVRLADAVGRRLRDHGVGARTWTLKIRFSGFVTITRSTTTRDSVDDGFTIVELLRPLLEAIDPSPGVRLLGVSGSNLGQPTTQLSFDDLLAESGSHDPAGSEGSPGTGAADRAAATEALDSIRRRFGDGAIGPASAVRRGRLSTVRRGAQQWGPDQEERVNDQEPPRPR
ncbi:MAG: DNA polymerase IV [Actinomycetota bacterium]